MNDYKNKVAWCEVCDQGWVEVVKELKMGKLFLCCSECETEWIDFKSLKNGGGFQDVFGKCIEASSSEIKEKGWDKFLIKN